MDGKIASKRGKSAAHPEMVMENHARHARGKRHTMGKYTGVIFDLDGVICFTDKYHYAAWKTVADKLGVEFNETINNRLRGVSRMDSLEIILEIASK